MQDLTLYYLFLKCNLMHYYFDKILSFTKSGCYTYSWPGNETDLHAVQQHPGEFLLSFIQRFSQVHNTIPRIANVFVVVAFRQGVRDEKMLNKLRHA
jgi:hypothetical protein